MNHIDYLLILSIVLILSISILLLAKGKNSIQKSILKYLPLLTVFFLLFSVFYITNYYQKKLKIQESEFNAMIQNKLNSNNPDSSTIQQQSNLTNQLDSLEKQNKELNQFLEELDKGERITGHRSKVKEHLEKNIRSNRDSIRRMRIRVQIADSTINN